MPPTPLRTLSIHNNGSCYTIYDTDDRTHLFTVRFNGRAVPHMTVIRGSNTNGVIGNATYRRTKKLGIPTASKITLKLPSSDAVSLYKEGGFFSNDKRTMRTTGLGHVYWSSRQVTNPWKGGRLETSFMRLADASGKIFVEYKDEGHTLERMGVLEIGVELTQDALDEVVVSGMAMLSEEQTGLKATRT